MFVLAGTQNAYPRPQRRRGWGRILVLTAALLLVTGRLAYGSSPIQSDRVVVAPGDTVWSIATAHYGGDPRPHVEAILAANRLATPILRPGQALQLPRD